MMLVPLLVGLAPVTSAATPSTVIASAGPLDRIWIGNDLSCQVRHVNDVAYQFFPSNTIPGDCGTFAFVDGQLYAPDFGNHGGTATGSLGAYTPFTPISQSTVTGAGTPSNPYQIQTDVWVGNTGIQLTQYDTYVVGNDYYHTLIDVHNYGEDHHVIIYRAGDCFLGGSDSGYGAVGISAPGSVACTKNANNNPPGRFEEFIPITPGSTYYHDRYDQVWSWIGGLTPFPNTCQCTTLLDNGAGLSWEFILPTDTFHIIENRLRFDVPDEEPEPIPIHAACQAHGILVRETDATGAVVETTFASSEAVVQDTGALPSSPASAPAPPGDPGAHADAQLAGFVYDNPSVPLTVRASTIHSQCDAAATFNVGGPLDFLTHAYGRAGVQDIWLRTKAGAVNIELLDFEADLRGHPGATDPTWACDDLEVRALLRNPILAICEGLAIADSSPALAVPGIDVVRHARWGPDPGPGGNWTFGGAQLHVHLDPFYTGTVAIDIYVGYVELTVTGGPGSMPRYVPNTGCVTSLCS